MYKEFLSYLTVRNNGIKMAYSIYKEGFIPDVVYVLLRGGAYLGNVISEYFKLLRRDRHPIYYAAVVARSYININQQSDVMVDGWTYNPEHLRQGDKVLLVDDIFDTGRTINQLVGIIMKKGIPREDVKIAVHDYKIRLYCKTKLPVQPDYYCRKHIVKTEDDDFWIHYLSHELVGLTQKEKEEYYYSDDQALREALESL
ncbi:MAG: phosphoribosyltransferase [Spirochaetes bacterium]|nr:phosphoribosyltransferase [Spirochaetota bacterium]